MFLLFSCMPPPLTAFNTFFPSSCPHTGMSISRASTDALSTNGLPRSATETRPLTSSVELSEAGFVRAPSERPLFQRYSHLRIAVAVLDAVLEQLAASPTSVAVRQVSAPFRPARTPSNWPRLARTCLDILAELARVRNARHPDQRGLHTPSSPRSVRRGRGDDWSIPPVLRTVFASTGPTFHPNSPICRGIQDRVPGRRSTVPRRWCTTSSCRRARCFGRKVGFRVLFGASGPYGRPCHASASSFRARRCSTIRRIMRVYNRFAAAPKHNTRAHQDPGQGNDARRPFFRVMSMPTGSASKWRSRDASPTAGSVACPRFFLCNRNTMRLPVATYFGFRAAF